MHIQLVICNVVCPSFYFFFFKQKTAYEMRISDWSSDVCSSDLRIAALPALAVSFLPRVIAAFRETHPGVTVQLQTRSSSTVRQWMANQQFDIDRKSTRLNSSH